MNNRFSLESIGDTRHLQQRTFVAALSILSQYNFFFASSHAGHILAFVVSQTLTSNKIIGPILKSTP